MMQFQPNEVRALREAYKLAKSTFEKTQKLKPFEQVRIARAVIDARTKVPDADVDRLATAAILQAITEPKASGALRASKVQRHDEC